MYLVVAKKDDLPTIRKRLEDLGEPHSLQLMFTDYNLNGAKHTSVLGCNAEIMQLQERLRGLKTGGQNILTIPIKINLKLKNRN
jgi:hypothetical protein